MDNLLIPSTFNKLGLLTLKGWIGLGSILSAIFLQMHNSEPSSDFRCDVKDNIDKDFVRGKCFDQYQKQNNKLGVPLYAFIMVNVLVIPVVSVIYSQCVKSTVTELERRHQDAEQRSLFFAYFCQLAVSCALRIIFIAFQQNELFYPRSFPADLTCSIKNVSVEFLPNQTKSTNSVLCFTQRAGDKNFWTETVKIANGIFAFFAFLEVLWMLSRARNGIKFMDNWQFYANHLKSSSGEKCQPQQEAMSSAERQQRAFNIPQEPGCAETTMSSEHPEHAQAQNGFRSAIQTMRENCLKGTDKLSDLKQPFGQPNHGEGHRHNLTIDKIYVHEVIVEGRASHNFATDRWEQLKEYPPDADDRLFKKPEDILDQDHKNVLVVGRPGIGKTSLSIKLLRLWASGEAFNAFNVVFLLKFRGLNDNAELSLRDLLAGAETVQRLDDSVWDFVQNESTKVLLIVDGLDEYSRKEEINNQEDYKNNVEEKMPVSVLYNKLVAGELLPDASILTTTRPTAVIYVYHVDFERTVEIRGFTSDDVKEYVENFARGVSGAKEKMWEHIKSNINLFSFCYIPMNCFLICHCLLKIILSESSQALPTKMTDIYKMTVKMFFFNHNREASFFSEELKRLKSKYMYEPFEKFPEEFQKIFNSLGEIAFKGIKEGRLLFESSEVSELEDCGLLHKLPDLKPKTLSDPPKSQFCFTHLTVQEFFAAKHLVNTMTDEGIERFVCKHINDGTWQVVLQFVAGLPKSSLSSNIFIKLLPKSTEEGRNFLSSEQETLTFWPATKEDKDVAVQVCKCLYEINDEQQPVLQNKIEKIKFNAVEFPSCSLAPIDLVAVLHFLEKNEEVLHIRLSDNKIGDLGAKEVKKFIVNRERKLRGLHLSGNNFTDNAAKDFAAALMHNNCKLESLDLSENNFTDNAAKDFAAALKHSNCKLESLALKFNKFTDYAAKDLAAALKHSNCKLESLDLAGYNFSDNAAKDLAAALKHTNCKLESLDLRFHKLTDNAAKDLAAALKHSNCKLKRLLLGYNNFTDNAAKDLGEALEHSNCKLKLLYIYGNNFTKKGRWYLTDTGNQSNCQVCFY
ncbi:NLR family CARD domain-containing protein 3-like [Acropora muricata]|uniref:NLR family CARD domain-containing protein 3-like n=1 Tax=Acropora muricata TaxID=159855 RepID=UPI0034E3D811